jgi:RNA polymerase sigma-70 factor (ECF subfamily)
MRNTPETKENDRMMAELVERSRQGDRSAFRLLMESQQGYAYAVAVRLLTDEENARDIVQEAFIRVWNNFHRYRKEIKFTTWLYTIVVNLCYDRIRMDSRRKKIFGRWSMSVDVEEIAGEGDVQRDIENSDLRRHVLRQAKKLPPKEYLVFHLRDVQDFSIEEIAEMAGMSVGSVKTNLCYARRRIRSAMNYLQSGLK